MTFFLSRLTGLPRQLEVAHIEIGDREELSPRWVPAGPAHRDSSDSEGRHPSPPSERKDRNHFSKENISLILVVLLPPKKRDQEGKAHAMKGGMLLDTPHSHTVTFSGGWGGGEKGSGREGLGPMNTRAGLS